MQIDINQWAFKYHDSEYLEWFSSKRKTKEIFYKMLKWKLLHRRINKDKAWKNWKKGNFDSYKLVTKAFLHHLKCPENYPILDKNVWGAFREIKGGINGRKIVKKPTNWENHYINGYKNFFDELYREIEDKIKSTYEIKGVNIEIIKRRILDQALWEYGRLLNNGQ